MGNVPFGEYKVHDRRYDRQNLLIHDYFITKALDKVRPGGVVAFITTKGTMDKQNSKVRQDLAQKADLLGAIRLPNNAFKANAGTEVTTDILFFQKRAGAPEKLPEWVQTGQTDDGVPLNSYFLQHPEMVLGTMSFWKGMYGNEAETACLPIQGADLKEQLAEAIPHIAQPDRELLTMSVAEQDGKGEESIPADPSARNFSFVLSKGQIYFRENSRMKRMELGKTPTARVKGMVAIRDSARKIIDLQLNGAGDAELQAEQSNLSRLYDAFTKKYGLLNNAGNRMAFAQDSSYPLLCSLEVLDDEGRLKRKADMFTKRTILHHEPVTSVDTAAEALAVSIGERACVDLQYMAGLMGGPEKIPQIVADLQGVIYKDPATGPFDMEAGGDSWSRGWQTADEYLSGNVREKLAQARAAAEEYHEFVINVESLEQVQPKELTAAEIEVRVGVDWIDPKYYQQFLFELLQVPAHLQNGKIQVRYDKRTGEWKMSGKSPARSIEDVDATALSYAEVKMLATGDPRIKEKMDLDIQVAKLKLLKSNHMAMKYEMEDKVLKYYPAKTTETKIFIRALGEDQTILNLHPVKEDSFTMTVQGQTYTERKKTGEAIIAACQNMEDPEKPVELGEYRGFPMTLKFSKGTFQVVLKQNLSYTAELGEDVLGNITRINHALEKIPENLEEKKRFLTTLEGELVNAREEAARDFPQAGAGGEVRPAGRAERRAGQGGAV